jgi:hypothetical protein
LTEIPKTPPVGLVGLVGLEAGKADKTDNSATYRDMTQIEADAELERIQAKFGDSP